MFLDYQLLKKCLFIDIETVSEYSAYDELPDDMKYLWDIKATQIKKSLLALPRPVAAAPVETKAFSATLSFLYSASRAAFSFCSSFRGF